MKKIKLLTLTVICMVLLAGCKQEVILTDEESEMLSEYMAYYVVNKEERYTAGLVTPTPTPEPTDVPDHIEDSNEEPSPDMTAAPTETIRDPKDFEKGNQKSNEDFAKALKFDGIELEYVSYEFTNKVADGILSIGAGKGKRFVVVRFDIKNQSTEDVSVEFGNAKVSYKLYVNGKQSVVNPNITLLDNDMRFLKTDIKAGDVCEAILIFEISESIDVQTLSLAVTLGESDMIYNIK